MKPISDLTPEELRAECIGIYDVDPGMTFSQVAIRNALRIAQMIGERKRYYDELERKAKEEQEKS